PKATEFGPTPIKSAIPGFRLGHCGRHPDYAGPPIELVCGRHTASGRFIPKNVKLTPGISRLRKKPRADSDGRLHQQVQARELADLRLQSTRHQAWQRNVDAAANNAIAVRQRLTLLGELEKMLAPPASPPEPEREIVYVSEDEMGSPNLGDPDFNVKAWMKKPRRWW